MNRSPQSGRKSERKRTEIETEFEAQTHIPHGPVGVLRGGVREVEVGAERGRAGTRGPGTPGTGSALTPVTAGTTEAAACPAARQNWK